MHCEKESIMRGPCLDCELEKDIIEIIFKKCKRNMLVSKKEP